VRKENSSRKARVRKDGSRFWVSAVVDAVHDASGALVGFVKITRDMTETRAAQVSLAASERRFRLLVTSVVDYALFSISPEGVVIDWNPGARRIKGYTADEIVGRHFSIFYTEEDRASGLPQRVLEIARREGKFEAEGWRLRKGGARFWAGVVIDPIRDETGEFVGFVKITRDLSERKALEEARERLFQSQKMETVGRLTGGIAHDFNNLLTGVIGSLELLQQKVRRGRYDDVDRYVTAATTSAIRAAALTHRLLAFSRRQPLDPKPVRANQLLAGMDELLRRTIGEKVSIELVLAGGLWTTYCDPNQLENAVLNLSINARDAMPDGGKVTIETCNAHLDDAYAARVRDVKPGQYVCIAVSDTGVGMSPETVEQAFDPFFTTKPLGHGTGLGLSMVYVLPGFNGVQFAEAARTTRPALKVLFMTGYAENAAVGSGFLKEGMELISKPFPIESLATRVRKFFSSN
jgi:PAS domain S-box-containing protein